MTAREKTLVKITQHDPSMKMTGKGRPTPRNPNPSEYKTETKRLNTPEFNRMAKLRRKKAKHDARARKINQRVARRERKS